MANIKHMKDFIKRSNFKTSTYVRLIVFLIAIVYFAIIIILTTLKKFDEKDIFIIATSWLILIVIIYFISKIKYIVVKNKQLKYYSFLFPFGRKIDLDSLKAKFILEMPTSEGVYKILYLLNKQNKICFEISEIYYKNFDEINGAIKLDKIRFVPTNMQYLKLLFFEKIKIQNIEDSNGINRNTAFIQHFIEIIGIIVIGLFVIGSIIKLAVKLN